MQGDRPWKNRIRFFCFYFGLCNFSSPKLSAETDFEEPAMEETILKLLSVLVGLILKCKLE